MWYDLRIGNWKCKITPIKQPKKEYENVDENGEPLKRVSGSYTKGHFEKSDGTIVEKAYKLINNKVVDKLTKTKEVVVYKEVDRKEVNNLISETYYYVDSEELKEELKSSGKALKFAYTNGNGFKIYIAYITLFGNALIMCCGLGYLSEQIEQIDDSKVAQQLLDELKDVGKVEKLKVEELVVI